MTTVEQNINFLSTQEFDVNATTDIQNAQQTSTVDSRTTTRAGHESATVEKHFSYPLSINYTFIVNADGSYYQTVTSGQKDIVSDSSGGDGWPPYQSHLLNEVDATDTLKWDASGNFLGPVGSKTTQTYRYNNSLGACYDRSLTAEAQALTAVTDGRACHTDDH